MSIIIEGEGLFSSFQDFGRKGYEHNGVIPGGALDPLSHEIANRLVAWMVACYRRSCRYPRKDGLL